MNKKKLLAIAFLLAFPFPIGMFVACAISYLVHFFNFASILFLYSVIWFVLFVYWFDGSEYQSILKKKSK